MTQLKHFPLPDVGEGLTEAEILGWKVQPGDQVTVNQVIVEIETAKAAVELPCPWEGTVRELLAEPGSTIEVGTPIIAIEAAGDAGETGGAGGAEQSGGAGGAADESNGQVANLVGYGPRSTSGRRRPRRDRPAPREPVSPEPVAVEARSESAAAQVPDTGIPDETAAQGGHSGRAVVPSPRGGHVPLAKPPVRKLAKDMGVDLHGLAGSGSGGVITRDDVRSAAEPATEVTEPDRVPPGGSARERRVPIKGVRKATAQAMVDSAFTAPHVTEFLTVDVTPMMRLREQLKRDPEFADVKVTPLAFAAKAMCLAARRTPDVNAMWDGEAGEIVYKDYVHLGVAGATPRGLVVPKVRDADGMSLRELAVALDGLTGLARKGRTPPADMADGTITITNVGVFGVDTGTPILNPGESAILALGAIRRQPWVVDDEIVPRDVCQLALSFDHRVVDGQQGSRFLADVGALLADPARAITY